jgi:hypothetical protein
MAGGVMRVISYPVAGVALFVTTFVMAAEQLRDPTRPPADVYKGVSTSGTTKSLARSRMVLQTVLIAEDRQAAVISGRLVAVGDTVSGFRITEIREGEVVLKGKTGTRTLRLFSDVRMSVSKIATLSEQEKAQQ